MLIKNLELLKDVIKTFNFVIIEQPRGSGLYKLKLVKRFTHEKDLNEFISKLQSVGLTYCLTTTSRKRFKVFISNQKLIEYIIGGDHCE